MRNFVTDAADDRRFAPATQRNREPILEVLSAVLPLGTVLEISSGTGEHAVFFAPRLAPRIWIPSDPDPIARASIAAWRNHAPTKTLYPPIALDVCAPVWPLEQAELPDSLRDLNLQRDPIQAIVNINMIHIAPWEACLGLLAGARRILPIDGVLYLYGPFQRRGEAMASSNVAFDQSLQAQNPQWGIRTLEAVVEAAHAQHLALVEVRSMPANNLSVIFRRCSIAH
jgi:hypothetical protein